MRDKKYRIQSNGKGSYHLTMPQHFVKGFEGQANISQTPGCPAFILRRSKDPIGKDEVLVGRTKISKYGKRGFWMTLPKYWYEANFGKADVAQFLTIGNALLVHPERGTASE